MKIIYILLLLLSISLLGDSKKTIIIKLNNNDKIKNIDLEMLKKTLEISLNNLGYKIRSNTSQEEVNTERLLPPKELLILNIHKIFITKKNVVNNYFISLKRLDFKTHITFKVKVIKIKKNYTNEKIQKKIREMIKIMFVEKNKAPSGKLNKKIKKNMNKVSSQKEGLDNISSKKTKTLTKVQVFRVIKITYPKIKSCGKINGMSGKVIVKFKIKRSGSISNIEIGSTAGKAKNCIYSKVKKMHFPKFSGKTISIAFPFRL